MNNLVVQLLLRTGSFSTDLKKAGGQVQSFQRNCSEAGKTVTQMSSALGINIGSLTRLGTVAGVAVAAVKGFKAVMESTQTTSDRLDDSIAGLKGVVDAFKVSIATADFSNFKNGLWDIFDGAVNARRALDDLGDARLGFNMISSDNQAGFAEAQNNYREAQAQLKTAKTKEEREKLEADMAKWKKVMDDYVNDEEKQARNFKYINMNAIKATVHQRNLDVNEKDVTEAVVRRAAEIFNSTNSQQLKDDAMKRAKEIKKEANKYKDSSKRQQYLNNYDRQFDLALAVLLDLDQKRIEAVMSELQEGRSGERAAQAMRRSYDRTIKGETTTEVTRTGRGGTTKVQKEELQIQEGSLTYWRNILADETKYRDALEKDTDEWKKHNDKVEEAQKMIEEIEGTIKKTTPALWNSLQYWNEIKDAAEKTKNESPVGSDEYNEAVATIKKVENVLKGFDLADALMVDPPTIASLEAVISIMTELRNEMDIGSKEFEEWGKTIENIQTKLNEAKGIKVEAPKTDTWKEFNSAMSNTSTIVSALTNTFKDGAEVTASSILAMVSTALPALGSLISSIEALTAAEAVEAGVAATGKAVSSSKHWIEAIAAVAALGSVVAAALSSARSQKFANGGIVGGTSFTGDRVTAQVNSGEMILNKAQQANLFRMANSGVGGGGQVEFHISGTELVGVLNNNNRKNNLIR